MTKDTHARAMEIFRKAVETAPSERHALLQRECGEDAELRREVESLLEHHLPVSLIKTSDSSPSSDDSDRKRFGPNQHHVTVRTTGTVYRWLFGTQIRRRVSSLVAAAVLVALGLWTHARIEQALLQIRANELQAVLNADVKALEMWIDMWSVQTRQIARDPRTVRMTKALLEIAKDSETATTRLRNSPERDDYLELVEPIIEDANFIDVALVSSRGFVLASITVANTASFLRGVGLDYVIDFNTRTRFVRPLREKDYRALNAGDSVNPQSMYVFVGTPVFDERGNVLAGLVSGLRASGAFTEAFNTAELGESGEAYAFDAEGIMLSQSRFTEELHELGLISALDDQAPQDITAQLNVQIRDPGGDMARGYQPELDIGARALTKLARIAIASRNEEDPTIQGGVLLEPYRNYRGVDVIGAWRWLPEHEFGVAVEMEVDEAFAPLRFLNFTFGVLLVFLAGAVAATFASSFSVMRLRRRVRELRQLGQYSVIKEIGEGGMGKIFLAEHAMLKRPTAVKILSDENLSPQYIARFEREVRLVSQLSHPNTIEIYDYGRTPDDVLYYAMEYVDGLNLTELVSRHGPVSTARTIYLMAQVCRSLQEAHGKGLIHRDVKPLNIMVCTKGGEHDVVKVLDFGLAKRLDTDQTKDLTSKTEIGGTPMYMAPERLTTPDAIDARVDVYAVGAVAYFLLSAQSVFSHMENVELLHHIVNTVPEQLSEVVKGELPAELVTLIMSCLSKDPEARPQTARELRERLESIPGIPAWRQEDATQWWEQNVS